MPVTLSPSSCHPWWGPWASQSSQSPKPWGLHCPNLLMLSITWGLLLPLQSLLLLQLCLWCIFLGCLEACSLPSFTSGDSTATWVSFPSGFPPLLSQFLRPSCLCPWPSHHSHCTPFSSCSACLPSCSSDLGACGVPG